MKVILLSAEELGEIIQANVRKVLNESSVSSVSDDNKPLTIDEAASFLQLPKATLYQFTAQRKIGHKKLGKRILFTKQNLLEFLEENQKKSRNRLENELFKGKGGSK